MAKKVIGQIKLQIPAGKATPAPPVGPALGQHGVNIMGFTKEFNAKTADQAGMIIPVVITVYQDRSFSFITLESYARALERSKKMMQIIDTAIDLMRRKHKKGEFYYWILYYAYLSPQQCENAGAILQLLETKGISISLRTYYVHRDEAIEVLSSILWGYTSQDCEKITNLLTPD